MISPMLFVILIFISLPMYTSSTDPVSVQDHLNSDLASLSKWVTSNGFTVNVSKSQSMLLARRHRRQQLSSIQFLLNNT